MDAAHLLALTLACAPQVHPDTALALIRTESALNPWAIGVVGGALERQPRNLAEALATARALQSRGWNFSVGLGQINLGNFPRLGLKLENAFEPCTNLAAMQTVLSGCFDSAPARRRPEGPDASGAAAHTSTAQPALRQALSCYYSGNFTTGFAYGYVRRVARALPGAPP